MYINVSEAFNYITHKRFIAVLYNHRISLIFIYWIQIFLTDGITMIRVFKEELSQFNTKISILWNFSILLILFLFFIAELLDTVNNTVLHISVINFMNNIYIFIYSYLTERNCRILKCIHKKCIKIKQSITV